MRVISFFLLLLIIALGITFACLNAEPVVLNYYFGRSRPPLSWLLFIFFGTGGFLGLLVGAVMYLKVKKENLLLAHRVRLAEKEVENVRVLPLKDGH